MRVDQPNRLPAEPGMRSPGGHAAIRAGVLLATALLTACAMPESDVTIRHFASTAFHDGTPFHIFVFDPDKPRSLNDRIRIARNEIQADPDCTWVATPTDVIAEATARQGTPWSDTLLAAPVRCTT